MIEMHGRNDPDVIPVAFQSETESLIYHVGLRCVNTQQVPGFREPARSAFNVTSVH